MKEIGAFPLVDKIPKRFRKPVYGAFVAGTGLFTAITGVGASCGGGDKPLKTSELQPRLTYSLTLPFAAGETWWYTGGPHYDEGSKSRVRYAIDVTPTGVGRPCPGSEIYQGEFVRAIADGVVTVVGNENDPKDKNHSVVEIDHGEGFTSGYIHLDDMQVEVRDTVTQGDALGYVSCEFPPGGGTDGQHLHFYGELNGRPIEVDRIVMSGWKIEATTGNNQGTMTKSGQATRTADTRRCGPDTYTIRLCNKSERIRNDISWRDPHEEYIATPKAQTVPTMDLVPTLEPIPTIEVPVLPTVESKTEGEGIDFSLKDSDGNLVDISEDVRYANKPILVFYYGRKFDASDSDLEFIKSIKGEFTDLAIMPVIVEKQSYSIQLLKPIFGEVFVDESNVQSEASIALRVQGYPSTVILDSNHKIILLKNGMLHEPDKAQIRAKLDLLEKR